MITQIAIEGKPSQPINDCTSDPCCQKVLEFLKQHPNTRFSRQAITQALNSPRFYTERALKQLTDSGMIKSHLKNNVPFYSLSAK